MSTNIYVGNLPFNTSEDEVRDLFTAYGAVTSVTLIVDRETGRLRGFGFVEMEDEQEAGSAIEALNGTDLQGRSLTVNIARPREDRRGGGGGGGNRGGGRDRRW
jgi:RNA recognition motif-containing protein